MDSVTTRRTRADIALALVDFVRDDRGLAEALAVNEAWDSGYVGRLLAYAEVLASQEERDDPFSPCSDSRDSVSRAVGNANPRAALERSSARHTSEMVAALMELLEAQAKFHSVTVALERRGLRRVPPRP